MEHQTTLCVGTWTGMRVIPSNGRSNLRHQSAMAATTKYLSKKSNARDAYREPSGHYNHGSSCVGADDLNFHSRYWDLLPPYCTPQHLKNKCG